MYARKKLQVKIGALSKNASRNMTYLLMGGMPEVHRKEN